MTDETTLTSPVSGTGEQGDTGSDNTGTENGTQDDSNASDDQTDVSAYDDSADNTSKTEDDDDGYKKRYSDSSREAQRLAAEVAAKQKEIDEWVEFVQSDPDLAETVKAKSGKTFGKEADKLVQMEQRLASIEKKEREVLIKSFEIDKKKDGFEFNPDVRKKIGAIAKSLEGAMTYDEALEVAFIRINKDKITQKASDTGKKQAFAQSKANSEAIYTTSNSTQGGSKTYTLTKEEQDYFEKMPVSPEKKKEHIEAYLRDKQNK